MRYSLRNSYIVVSMSTTPQRINNLDKVLQSLSAQNAPIKNIYLNIPYIFKRDGSKYHIPQSLDHYQLVKILRTEDYGPATKLLGLVKNNSLPESAIIITVDDDIAYPKNTILHLAYNAKYSTNAAIGLSGTDIYAQDETMIKYDTKLGLKTRYNYTGNVQILQGYAGIAYHKSFFDDDILAIDKYPKSCIDSDDIYFSFYLARKKIKRQSIANDFISTNNIPATTEFSCGADALHNQPPGANTKNNQCIAYLNKTYPLVKFGPNSYNN